jgi:Protein of unknown function (DUF3293)
VDDVFEAYRKTRYEVQTPGGKVVLRHGERSPELDRLLDAPFPGWAFITAWNPGSNPRLSIDENRRRQQELEAALSPRYRTFPGKGVGDDGRWPPEESVLVLGISRDEALRFGRQFGQLAILAGSRGEPAEVVAC